MFIEQAYKGLTDAWRYIVGGAIIVVAWQIIGSIPLIAGLFLKIDSLGDFPTDIPGMAELLGKNLFLFLMLLSFAIGIIGIFISYKYLHHLTITQFTTTRPKIDWKRFWFIFILWGVISSSLVLIDYFFINPDEYVLNFELKPFLILLVIGVLMFPLQTSFEEYAFRGYGMHFLGTLLKNRWAPLIITSILFGVMHIFNPEVKQLGYITMVYYIGTGFFLGIITLMDDGLELALGFHAANNLLTALLITTSWGVLQTPSILLNTSEPEKIAFAEIFVPVFVVFPILLFILSKKYKWTNWKDKLFGPVVEPPKEDYKILEE